jgi:hypothetical protein
MSLTVDDQRSTSEERQGKNLVDAAVLNVLFGLLYLLHWLFREGNINRGYTRINKLDHYMKFVEVPGPYFYTWKFIFLRIWFYGDMFRYVRIMGLKV